MNKTYRRTEYNLDDEEIVLPPITRRSIQSEDKLVKALEAAGFYVIEEDEIDTIMALHPPSPTQRLD